MLWKAMVSLAALTVVGGGIEVATTAGCTAVELGRGGRAIGYACTYGLRTGQLSASRATMAMVGGGILVLMMVWVPGFVRRRR